MGTMDSFALLQDGYRISLSIGVQVDGLFAWRLHLCQLTSAGPGALVAAGGRHTSREDAERAGMAALLEYRALHASSPSMPVATLH
ncbi:hypothetical protein C7R54_25135 [Achromobacter aloeverae]|uniref:DRBM domain-containing protein n=1 Tax=Achromobacter aloeverae TaxID=1750518 RepID=A0A4V1MRK6_9BURK|nr:hypothetical protein C7R54_25135 [Achromobacter aloeverae]